MEDNRIYILKEMPVGKAITKLALPAIIGFMVMAIYNATDTFFISRWNYKGASAAQVLFPIMMIGSSIGLSFGIGSGSYISRLLGKNSKDRATSVVSTSFFSAILVAIFYVSIVYYFLPFMVKLFGAKGEILGLSVDYGKYIVIGAMFVIPSMVLNNSLRAEGSAKLSMIGMGLGSLINIIIDPIFIFTFDMGIKGAAIATFISQGISLLILSQWYLRKKTVLNLSYKYFKFEVSIYKEIFKIGLPTLFRQLLFSVSMGMVNTASMKYGSYMLLSAMGISQKISSIPMFFIFGMGQGLQPVVGYNFGAKNSKRVLMAEKEGMKKTFRGALIFSIILFIFARILMNAFVTEPKVIEYGVLIIRFTAFGILFTSISNTIAVIFQALGFAKISLMFSVLRQGILLIPMILVFPYLFGDLGVILSMFFADLFTLIISVIVYIPYLQKERNKLKS